MRARPPALSSSSSLFSSPSDFGDACSAFSPTLQEPDMKSTIFSALAFLGLAALARGEDTKDPPLIIPSSGTTWTAGTRQTVVW